MIQTVKQNKKAVLVFFLALVMLIGFIPFTAIEVQALNTISTGDTFEHGDQINVYCVGSGKSVIYTASVSEGVTTWTSDETLFFAPGNTTITACYPLRTHLSRVSLPLDQSTEAKVKSADHMAALSSGTLPSEPVELHFKHLMAKITVKYQLATEFDVGTPIAKAEIYSKHTEFQTFSPAGGEFRKSLTPNWITSWINGNEFTAIVSPEAYTAGDEFIRITIGNQELTAKMPEDKQLEEGKHYTFDLTVGKNAIKITSVNVSGDWSHNEGWNDEVILNGSYVGIKDVGKKAWENGDRVIATLTSPYYGEQTAMLTYDGINWTHPEDMTFKYLENEMPTVKAVYAPSNILGTGEYIEFDCELNGEKLPVKLESATRNYSRLRIIGLPNQTLTVTTTDFTPAGATEAGEHTYPLTADNNGNAFLYGTFGAGGSISVHDGDNDIDGGYAKLADYTFGETTEAGKSYALDAHTHVYDENGSCNFCGKRKITTITFDTDGGSAVAPITQECGTAVTAPTNPTKANYLFDGWSPALPTTMPTENITVKALWKEAGYTVTWKNWDGTVLLSNYNVAKGTIPSYGRSNPQKGHDGQYAYVFSGWSPAVTAVTGDVTYTATFDAIPLSEYTYQIGDRVTASADAISYCATCGRLLKNYTVTITGVRGVLDGKTIYWVTRECCGHKSSIIETEIHGFA